MEGEDASHKIKEIQMARAPVGLLRDVLVEEESKNGDAVGAARETDAAAQRRRAELASPRPAWNTPGAAARGASRRSARSL